MSHIANMKKMKVRDMKMVDVPLVDDCHFMVIDKTYLMVVFHDLKTNTASLIPHYYVVTYKGMNRFKKWIFINVCYQEDVFNGTFGEFQNGENVIVNYVEVKYLSLMNPTIRLFELEKK